MDQPQDVQAEIIRINTDARVLALQVALLVPLLAGRLGSVTGFRMMRLPDPVSSGSAERVALALCLGWLIGQDLVSVFVHQVL